MTVNRSDFQGKPLRTTVDDDALLIGWDPTDPAGEPFVAPKSSLGGASTFSGDAADVPFTPAGTVAATNVQEAIVEVATDVASLLASYLTSAAAPELIRDTMGTALVAGTNITITVSDAGDSITIAASGGGGGAVATDTIFDAKGDLPVGTGSDTASKLAVGSNGTTVIADSNASTGLRYVGSPRTKAPRTVSQAGYYMPDTFLNVATVATQSAATAQEAYWFPFWLPRRATPTIAVQCFTLESGSTIRLSTWSNDEATFKPATGGLIEDLGTVSGASTGTKELTCATALNPGWVWVGVWCSNHTTVRWGRNSGSTAAVNHSLMGDAGVYSGRGVYGWYASTLDYSSAWNSTLPSLTAADFASKFNPPTPYMHNL